MQVAQPITLSFYCRAYADAFSRDFARLSECYSRINLNPLGAGAVAGTTWNIDREHTAKLLGFSGVQQSPLDAVTSRGEMEAELIFCLTLLLCFESCDIIFSAAASAGIKSADRIFQIPKRNANRWTNLRCC